MSTESHGAAPKSVDWYERRHDLREGMVFNTHGGCVMLDRRVPGDGTKWYAATWCSWSRSWSYEDYTVEPGDLIGLPMTEATFAALEGESNG